MRISALLASLALAACGSSNGDVNHPAPDPTPKPTASAPKPAQPKIPKLSTGKGTVKTATFTSKSLGVDKQYYVYLPGGYETSGARYPVIYMLHGLGGSENNWTKYMGLTEAADAMKLAAIVVMPDGDNSFYTNNAIAVPYDKCLAQVRPGVDMKTLCVKTPRYEDYMTKDLIDHVDRTYRTVADRSARGIGGLSMGGFGALMLAMRNTHLYGATASHSGVDSLLYAGPFPYAKGQVKELDDPKPWIKQAGVFGIIFARAFGDQIGGWRAHDPVHLARKLPKGKLDIYLDCGTEDRFRLQNHAQYLHEVLGELGHEHTWYLGPGKHDAAFWKDRIDDSLGFFVAFFAKRAGS